MNTKLIVPAPGVLANDSDADGNHTMEAGMPTNPRYGRLVLSANGSFTYMPNTGFQGTDTFTYMVMEASNVMPTAKVTITVGSGTAQPTLAVNNVSVTEGNAGVSSSATFTITRSGSTAGASSVTYSTMNGTATAGSDYTAVAPTVVNFAAGVATKTVIVTVLGDNVDEVNETFSVKLSSPTGATISDDTGVGTITDDDGPATSFVINDTKVTEANAGASVNAVLTVTRSGVTTGTSTVKYVTTGGTALKGTDYENATATLTFGPGETSKTVTVKVLGDNMDEPNETFFVKLSAPTNATIADLKGIVTITDND